MFHLSLSCAPQMSRDMPVDVGFVCDVADDKKNIVYNNMQ